MEIGDNMNNKGFTLVELIAIIGLLAIIVLISIPSFTNQIEWSRKNNYDNFISDLCLAAESYVNHSGEVSNFSNAGDTITINIEDLKSNGYIKSNLKNPKTNEVLSSSDILTVTITEDLTYSCELN